MNCRNVRKRLSAYQDRELCPDEQEQIEREVITRFLAIWKIPDTGQEARFFRSLPRNMQQENRWFSKNGGQLCGYV